MNNCQSCVQPFLYDQYSFKMSLYFYKYKGASLWEEIIVLSVCSAFTFSFCVHICIPNRTQKNTCIHVFTLLADSFSDSLKSFAIPSLIFFNLYQNFNSTFLLIFSLKSIPSYRERILPLPKLVLRSKLYKCFNYFGP